jgi:hypothetical protein
MPNDKISIAPQTYGGKPGGDPFGDIDESASFQQIPGVYKPPMPPSTARTNVDANHGGNNSAQNVMPASDSISIHQSIGEQADIAGSLTRSPDEYSHSSKRGK